MDGRTACLRAEAGALAAVERRFFASATAPDAVDRVADGAARVVVVPVEEGVGFWMPLALGEEVVDVDVGGFLAAAVVEAVVAGVRVVVLDGEVVEPLGMVDVRRAAVVMVAFFLSSSEIDG